MLCRAPRRRVGGPPLCLRIERPMGTNKRPSSTADFQRCSPARSMTERCPLSPVPPSHPFKTDPTFRSGARVSAGGTPRAEHWRSRDFLPAGHYETKENHPVSGTLWFFVWPVFTLLPRGPGGCVPHTLQVVRGLSLGASPELITERHGEPHTHHVMTGGEGSKRGLRRSR